MNLNRIRDTARFRACLGALAGAATIVLADPAAAQERMPSAFAELRGGAAVPTFDIADVATTGAAIGATLGYHLSPRWVLMGELDVARHEDKATGMVDIDTRHLVAKVGYSLTGPRERGWEAVINLGVGAVSFDIEGGDTFTYPAINAGAKLTYSFNRSFALVLSPQGDIAFSKDEEIGTTNAWVWPFTAGLRVRF